MKLNTILIVSLAPQITPIFANSTPKLEVNYINPNKKPIAN
jgi:hypothetical protein